MKKILKFCKNNFPFFLLLSQAFLLTALLISPNSYIFELIYNIFFSVIITTFLTCLPIGYIAASIIETIIFSLVFYINELLIEVRMRPLNFMDIYCINDAANVTNSYSPIMNTNIAVKLIIAFAVTILNCGIIIKYYKKPKKISLTKHLLSAGICSVFVIYLLFFNSIKFDAENLTWDENEYVKEKGIFLALYSEYQKSIVKEPEGYSGDKAAALLNKYPYVKSQEDTPVNIIVIMNESFTDYSYLLDSEFSADPLESIHNLKENFKEGRLAVNNFAGGTCNSEFEFLTGCSLAFMNQDEIPYIRYNLSNVSSIANDITDDGYKSTPIHPYIGAEWRRNTIYPRWFTEEFISGEKFSKYITNDKYYDEIFDISKHVNFGDDLEYVGNYISDAEDFRKVMEVTKLMNAQNNNSFIFNITMQNHGAYNKDVKTDVDEFRYTGVVSSDIYLTLSKYSSEAYVDFIEKLKDYPEPTVVLMFGDHQPGENYLSNKVDKYDNDSLGRSINKYIVPYMLWANYDIEWDIPDFLSLNYLSAVLKKNCNLTLTQFDSMRLEAMKKYPVLTYRFSIDKNGNYVDTFEAQKDEVIKDYECIQYDKIFGIHDN